MARKTPTGDEAAAVAAAISRFEAEMAVPSGDGEVTVNQWQRAALLEGVGAKEPVQESEGGFGWQS